MMARRVSWMWRGAAAKGAEQAVTPVKLAYKLYEEAGAPPARPVLVMHGLLGNKNNWATPCKRLAERTAMRLVAVDARNHGASPHADAFDYPHLAADAEQLLQDLGAEESCLVGHSMGGRAAMYLALTRPHLVTSLVVVDVSPVGLGPGFWALPKLLDLLRKVELRPAPSLAAVRAGAEQQLAVADPFARRFLVSNIVEREPGKFSWAVNLDSLHRNFKKLAEFPVAESTFKKPALFICGAESDYVPKSQVPKILEIFPKASIMFVERAGHLVHIDQTDYFVDIVSAFISRYHKFS